MKKKMVQIGWIADYTVKTHLGGSQRTNEEMVKFGRGLGYTIDYITPENFNLANLGYDLFILNNIVHFKPEQIQAITDKKRYVRFEHDYDAIINLDRWPNLFKNSLANIFLSPLHLQKSEQIMQARIKNSFTIPSPIDKDRFKVSKGLSRQKNSVFWSGNLHPAKGVGNVLRWLNHHPEKRLFVAGLKNSNDDLVRKIKNHKQVEFLGQIDYEKMADEYRKYETFIHLPNWKEPFGRTLVEAYLCGCHIVANDNCGALSYNWDWNDYDLIRDKVNQSQKLFWETIKDGIKA